MAKTLKQIIEEAHANSVGKPAHTLMTILDKVKSPTKLEHRPPEIPLTPDDRKPDIRTPINRPRGPGGYSR
jgi:hypothetical protein